MKTHFTEPTELIATEEKAAFANVLARRMGTVMTAGPRMGGGGLMSRAYNCKPARVPYILC